jgi:multiple sugar transport system substrate-binding protein
MKHGSVVRIAGAALVGILAAGALTSCSSGDTGGGGESGGAEGGGTVSVTLANHVWTDIIKEKIPEFEAETGIKVELTQLAEDQLTDQYKVKLNAGSSDMDVMMYRPLQEGKLFGQSNYFADMTEMVEGNAEWDWSDFQGGPVGLTTYQDKVVGVPIITETEVLYYRKDLLEQAGLEVPTTLEELEAAAKAISEANPGVAGFVSRTGRSAAVTQLSGYLYSFGGEWVDDEGNSAVGSDEAKAAYAYYGGLLRNYGPENLSTDMSWPEAFAIFTQGNAAFLTDASSLYKNTTDPEKSTVGDQVGFAAFPSGPGGSHPYNVAAWGLGINSASKSQDNAWKFIEWATSPEMTLEVQAAGVPGARTSAWEDPAGTSNLPADLAKAIAANGAGGVGADRPLVIGVAEAREIVGGPIIAAIAGDDSDAAADDASAALQQLLDSER